MASDAFNFDSLVTAIERTHSALAGQASKAVNLSLTLRNWFIGYYIAEFELQGADRASYGDKLLAELSRALRNQSVSNTGRRQLYGYLAFYRTYPQIVRAPSALSAQIKAPFLLEEKVRALSAQFPDAQEIEHALDHLLSCACHPEVLLLFKTLCRYYYPLNSVATADYINCYREMWDTKELLTKEGETDE